MCQCRRLLRLQFGNDPQRECLAQLNAPLVKGVNSPDRSLHEYLVLIESDQRAQQLRSQPIAQDGIGRPVTLKGAMRDLECRDTLRGSLLRRLAKGQRLGLGKQIGHQQGVMWTQWIERLAEANKVRRDQLGALMDELVIGMLAI